MYLPPEALLSDFWVTFMRLPDSNSRKIDRAWAMMVAPLVKSNTSNAAVLMLAKVVNIGFRLEWWWRCL
jgi:hypothetical protein